MEKQPKWAMKLSLKEIAMRKIIAGIYQESDILAPIGKFQFKLMCCNEYHKRWRETVEENVKQKISKLVLPQSLKKQLNCIAKLMGFHLRDWKEFHECYLFEFEEQFDIPVLEKMCWTTAGTVDYRKTAEELIRYGVVDIEKRYQLACLYCLEDFISVLWEELSEDIKRVFYNEDETSQILHPHLYRCWPYILKGEESKLDNLSRSHRNQFTFTHIVFEYSATTGNKTAAEYFFQKLTHEERESSLIRAARGVLADKNLLEASESCDSFPKENLPDVLCYLLSRLSPKQQMKIFKEKPSQVLRCFFYWPWQDLFLEIAELIWNFLPESHYDDLLKKIGLINSEYLFPSLYQKFFIHSPRDFKKHFVDRECRVGSSLFSDIFFTEDSVTIEVIFRNIDVADRARLVFSERVFKLFKDFILRGEWHMVEAFLREATLSKEDRDRLKEDFTEFLRSNGQLSWWRKRKFKRFFQFLDEPNVNLPEMKSSED
ncbi:hypothetical protein AVEN_44749-1 [Araneus ventricosus]|uniref:Uncharacterized protein n=1 Tax=Araneus ventricosus TaxID=182803 RepID=A0A4Y2HQF1_ARAVE|nr:hypothetical protein AVEN_44749-1 [Araneus ventricosus]